MPSMQASVCRRLTFSPTTLALASLVHKKTRWNSAMTNLRQIANHPLQKYDDRDPNADPEDIVNLSGKMMLLDRVLPELFRREHKVCSSSFCVFDWP